jgi:hypothetical protein
MHFKVFKLFIITLRLWCDVMRWAFIILKADEKKIIIHLHTKAVIYCRRCQINRFPEPWNFHFHRLQQIQNNLERLNVYFCHFDGITGGKNCILRKFFCVKIIKKLWKSFFLSTLWQKWKTTSTKRELIFSEENFLISFKFIYFHFLLNK